MSHEQDALSSTHSAALIVGVVMAGGRGTRFWPLSRETTPKQTLALAPGRQESLVELACLRLRRALGAQVPIVVVTGEVMKQSVMQAVAHHPEIHVLVEPIGRNTAPCIAWAAAWAARRDPRALLVVSPADHHISDESAFADALSAALAAAEHGAIATLGLRPSEAATGYGYIEVGAPLEPPRNSWAIAGVKRRPRPPAGADNEDPNLAGNLTNETGSAIACDLTPKGGGAPGALHRAYHVTCFVEKPDAARAAALLTSGKHLWNSGLFVLRAATAKDELCAADAAYTKVFADYAAAEDVDGANAQMRTCYPHLPSISFDYAVMERTSRAAVVPADFGWSDIGTWEAAYALDPKDAAANSCRGTVAAYDTQGSLVWSLAGRQVIMLGCSGLIVVDTPDALLVMPRDRAQDCGNVVPELDPALR